MSELVPALTQAAAAAITRLLDTSQCGCTSHALLDNEGACGHCQAGGDAACAVGCPVGKLDELQATDGCPDLDRSWMCVGKPIATDPRRLAAEAREEA